MGGVTRLFYGLQGVLEAHYTYPGVVLIGSTGNIKDILFELARRARIIVLLIFREARASRVVK